MKLSMEQHNAYIDLTATPTAFPLTGIQGKKEKMPTGCTEYAWQRGQLALQKCFNIFTFQIRHVEQNFHKFNTYSL